MLTLRALPSGSALHRCRCMPLRSAQRALFHAVSAFFIAVTEKAVGNWSRLSIKIAAAILIAISILDDTRENHSSLFSLYPKAAAIVSPISLSLSLSLSNLSLISIHRPYLIRNLDSSGIREHLFAASPTRHCECE